MTRAVLLIGLVLQLAGCVWPRTTRSVLVADLAHNLPADQRSVMHLSSEAGGYKVIDPGVPDVRRSYYMLRWQYFPPGAIAVAPGEHSFFGGKFYGHCKFTVTMVAGHRYRPIQNHCRYGTDASVDAVAKCWASHPESRCCTEIEDIAPDGVHESLMLVCDSTYPPSGTMRSRL